MFRSLFLLLALMLASPATAQTLEDVIEAELRPGWRLADGTHVAGLELRLAPGWKTYWRSPGDAGIPPLFEWRGSAGAIAGVRVEWPTPIVFFESGMRSVGYSDTVIFPVRVSPVHAEQDLKIRGIVDLGVCKDVCIPHQVRVDAVLPAGQTKPDSRIAAALASLPLSAAEAGIRDARCRVAPIENGMSLTAEVAIPRVPGQVETVIETGDPRVWVAEPDTRWQGDQLIAETRMRHQEGGPFAVDRSDIRITVLQRGYAVEIQGCRG